MVTDIPDLSKAVADFILRQEDSCRMVLPAPEQLQHWPFKPKRLFVEEEQCGMCDALARV